jgi:short subunit dehydrogenase-like uncharacterized protein
MSWLIYGANGYTGRLIAREAVRRGLQPVLAGRNEASIRSLAEELGLDFRVVDLDDGGALRSAISGQKLVLHCAGPFSATSAPMLAACLAEHAHYLDITGEIDVFAAVHARSNDARRSDVVLLPGAGFDVVPSDCLAASLVEALPAATRLQLAFDFGGGPSAGTAKTTLEGLAQGGRVRRDGELVPVPLAWKSRAVPFAAAERTAVTIPWGDVYTAQVSTGVPDIEVYMAMPAAAIRRLQRLRPLLGLLSLGVVRSLAKSWIERRMNGPSAEERAATGCELWGEVRTADGRSAAATMTTPNGYDLTVTASLGIVEFLLQNDVEGGFYTPSLLMGSGYAATLPGVSFRRVS